MKETKNALEQFYIDLDSSGWDVQQENDINQRLQEVSELLSEAELTDLLHLAEIDRQIFHFSKSPEKRLSFRVAGVQKSKDGNEIPYEWPDVKTFDENDFNYLSNRFNKCKNTYAKTEYGLVLFYSKQKLDNVFVIQLLEELFNLLKKYLEKSKTEEENKHYIIYSRTVLSNALFVSNNRKNDEEVKSIFEALIKYTFETHQSWDITHSLIARASIVFSDFAVKYYSQFSQIVKTEKILVKNWEVTNTLSSSDIWGTIEIIDISIKLCRKSNINIEKWLSFKATQYEKLSIKRKDSLASLSFVEKAMSIYRNLKDEKNLNRLQQKYQQLRTESRLGEVQQEIPHDKTRRIFELIKKEVKEKKEEDIVKTFLFTPMIRSLNEIKEWSKNSEETMFQKIPVNIQDKFGNTIARFNTKEELENLSLFRAYEFHIQIAKQTIIKYFIEAFRANKISAIGIISLLNQTWLGDNSSRISNGKELNYSYVKIIESGINSLFEELNKWKSDVNYTPNFVCATDSLVLKAEYLLREFCSFLGIATFKPKPRCPEIIMEKTLDNLLDDLREKISDNDHFFIKFILTDKVGYNLRNRIAHGLMDNIDYGIEYPIFSIIIILKLSNYQLKTT